MANTYTLISSNTLTSSAASVTFSSIPASYTDLVLRMSLRVNSGGSDSRSAPLIRFNGDTASNYSRTNLRGDGSAAASFAASSLTYLNMVSAADADLATANTFSNLEVYIPNYTVSANKPIASFQATENNATLANIGVQASLWRNTAAITQIDILRESTWDFVSGSSFYLYGIKNS